MARDVGDDNYYVTTGGKIPLKWTSLEVHSYIPHYIAIVMYNICAHDLGNILQEIFSSK